MLYGIFFFGILPCPYQFWYEGGIFKKGLVPKWYKPLNDSIMTIQFLFISAA